MYKKAHRIRWIEHMIRMNKKNSKKNNSRVDITCSKKHWQTEGKMGE
jgi:hypothetical protein